VLTFFGFMHGEAIGLAVTPTVAVAYLIVAGFIFALARYPQSIAMETPGPKPVARPAPAE
jgi:AGZA family xanthine/uracil permease-like MFS transporter